MDQDQDDYSSTSAIRELFSPERTKLIMQQMPISSNNAAALPADTVDTSGGESLLFENIGDSEFLDISEEENSRLLNEDLNESEQLPMQQGGVDSLAGMVSDGHVILL